MERLEYNMNEYACEVISNHYNRTPRAYVRCFGCQQNVNDTERIKGVLLDLGFELAATPDDVDLVLFNTCAVREHAEQRVFGNIGALKALKQKKSGMLIGICGCMPQQRTTIDKLRESYPYVDLVMGANAAHVLPEVLIEKLTTRKKALRVPVMRDEIAENVPIVRDSGYKAFLPIMYGCDNFCSYCIVPYTRGRERSRQAEDIKKEFESLVNAGYKEITLLGQNVNSYGKGLDDKTDFSDLLSLLAQIPGEYKIRFMTSHPKDATRKMIDTMAQYPNICKHLHLPAQSGANGLLSKMNRSYTAEDYLALIRYAKEVCPEMTFSSDIMVGFPGETDEDFNQTLELIKEVEFTQLFTFIYSKRPGTEAAKLTDETPHAIKSGRIQAILDLQEEILPKLAKRWENNTYKAIVDEVDEEHVASARMDNNMLVEFKANADIKVGDLVKVKILNVKGAILSGTIV